AYAIESSIKSKIFSHVIVSTEDKEIARISQKFGAEVPFSRPKKLATDSTGMTEVLLHGLKKLHALGYDFDTFVNRDCTVPFLRNKDVAGSIRLLKRKNCNAVFGVYRQHLNPYFNIMELGSNGFLKLVKNKGKRSVSRQTDPIVYQLNGLFAYNTEKFFKYRNDLLLNALPYEIPIETGFMIDTEFEFKLAEFIIQKKIIRLD
ncbi:MAG: acylneuraminate cytidylyltransferase family protein, partial [SAR202 cluster bacterium]|nr:acylneuraminate cytidylyltransferase family protein [SAR202 cluster bacterium]